MCVSTCAFVKEANIARKLVQPVRGWTNLGVGMPVSVQDVGQQLESSLDARLVQYVTCTREELGAQQHYHMTTDKAFASGMHLQNTLISVPDGRMALATPQAAFLLSQIFPFESFPEILRLKKNM